MCEEPFRVFVCLAAMHVRSIETEAVVQALGLLPSNRYELLTESLKFIHLSFRDSEVRINGHDTILRWHGHILTTGALFISNRRTGRTVQMQHLETLEPNFAAPPSKIRSGIVERIAELDQHVQRHKQPK